MLAVVHFVSIADTNQIFLYTDRFASLACGLMFNLLVFVFMRTKQQQELLTYICSLCLRRVRTCRGTGNVCTIRSASRC